MKENDKETNKKELKTNEPKTKRKPTIKKMTINERLIKVIEEADKDDNKISMPDPNDANVNKLYLPVRNRIRLLRKEFGFDIKIVTTLVNGDDLGRSAVFETQIYIKENKEWFLVSNAHALEEKGSNTTNKINFLENCETSSVGRAIGFLGLDGGGISDMEVIKQNTNKGTKESKGNPIKKSPKNDENITKKQINEIKDLARKTKRTIDVILKSRNINKLDSLKSDEADEIIHFLKEELKSDTVI